MKKVFLIILSIILLLITLFFLLPVIAFTVKGDIEEVEFWSIPFLISGCLFIVCVRKYLKLINFEFDIKKCIEKVKNIFINIIRCYLKSRTFRIIDIIISVFTYSMFFSSLENKEVESGIPFFIVSMIFALLYIIKTIINEKTEIIFSKGKAIYSIITIALSAIITYICGFIKEIYVSLSPSTEVFTFFINPIIGFIEWATRITVVTGLSGSIPTVIYLSLILFITNCIKYKESRKIIINFCNGMALLIYGLLFLIHFNVIKTRCNYILIIPFVILGANYLSNVFVNKKSLRERRKI